MIDEYNGKYKINCCHNINCIELLNGMESNSVDLVFTSPPYNINMDYDNYNDNLTCTEYYNFMLEVSKQIYRLLKNDKVFCNVIGEQRNSDLLTETKAYMREAGFKIIKVVVWYKGLSFSPVDYIVIGSKTGKFDYYQNYGDDCFLNGIIASLWNKRYAGEEVRRWHGEGRLVGHNAIFSLSLVKKALEIFTKSGDLVLDPFAGTGTTLVMSKKMGRKYIGSELSSKYVSICNSRLNELKNNSLEKYFTGGN